MLQNDLLPPKPAELFVYVNGEFLPDSQWSLCHVNKDGRLILGFFAADGGNFPASAAIYGVLCIISWTIPSSGYGFSKGNHGCQFGTCSWL